MCSSFSLYQIGISVWYHRRRDIGQSMLMLSIQSNKNCRLRGGWNSICSINSSILSCICVWRTYHSFRRMISTGFFPRSETGTSCCRSSMASMLPSISNISIAFARASRTDNPSRGPEIEVMHPFKSIAWNGARPSSLKTATSF